MTGSSGYWPPSSRLPNGEPLDPMVMFGGFVIALADIGNLVAERRRVGAIICHDATTLGVDTGKRHR